MATVRNRKTCNWIHTILLTTCKIRKIHISSQCHPYILIYSLFQLGLSNLVDNKRVIRNNWGRGIVFQF